MFRGKGMVLTWKCLERTLLTRWKFYLDSSSGSRAINISPGGCTPFIRLVIRTKLLHVWVFLPCSYILGLGNFMFLDCFMCVRGVEESKRLPTRKSVKSFLTTMTFGTVTIHFHISTIVVLNNHSFHNGGTNWVHVNE